MRRSGLCDMWIVLPFILSVALALPSQGPPVRPPPGANCIRMTPEKEEQIDLIVAKLGAFLNNLTIEHEHFDIRLIKLSIEQHTEDEVEEKETMLQLSVNDCQLSDDEIEEIDRHREKAKEEQGREAKEEKLKLESEKSNGNDSNEQAIKILKKKQDTPKKDEHLNCKDEIKTEVSNNEQQNLENTKKSGVHEQKQVETLSKKQENQKDKDKSDDQNKEKAKTIEHENNENFDTSRKEGEILRNEPEIQESDDKTNIQEVEKINNNKGKADTNKKFQVMYLDLDEKGQKLLEAMGKKKKGPKIVYVQERNSGQTEYWFLKRR